MTTPNSLIRSAVLIPTFRRKVFQPVWSSLHRLSLWGMNIGPGGSVENSGEDWVLQECLRRSDARKPFTLLDVGANTGQYATLALRIGDKRLQLCCFEPSESTFRQLQSTLYNTGARPFNFGLSSRNCEATLYCHLGGEAEASLHHRDMSHWGISQSQSETVQLRRMDEFCFANGIAAIDFLKLDVEGHEGAVLDGAGEVLTQGRIRYIQFEFGAPNIESRTYFRDFYRRLNPMYHLYRIVYRGLVPISNYSEFHENFATANFLAELREQGDTQ